MKKIFAIVFSFTCLFVKGDTLWWQANNTATVDGQDIFSFVNSFGTWTEIDPDTGEEFSGYNICARLTCTFVDGRKEVVPTYLNFGNSWEQWDYVDFLDDCGGGRSFGTAHWGTQSMLHEIPGYSYDILDEIAFQVELGILTYDDVLDIVDFNTIAESETASGKYLANGVRSIFWGGVNVPAQNQWTPVNFHTIPEPSLAMLFFIGTSLLVLRRTTV